MTRRQALETALKQMEKNSGPAEAAAVIRGMIAEMPCVGWSDDMIRDAVEQFIADNGRIPRPSDFGKKPLPPHTVIRYRYRMNCSEWLKRNYPASDPAKTERAAVTEKFTEEYRRIGPLSAREFDRRRGASVPCSATVCRHHGGVKWSELLRELQLPAPESGMRQHGEYTVTVTVHTNFDFEENGER